MKRCKLCQPVYVLFPLASKTYAYLCIIVKLSSITLISNDLHSPLKALLDDPLYIGVPQKRVTGKPYDDLIDEFINAATNR